MDNHSITITHHSFVFAILLCSITFILLRNPFDAVDISVGLSVEDPLYNQKRAYLDKSGRGATSVRFPLQRNR